MKWVDTNVVCSFLTDLDPELQERSARILENGETYFVSDLVLFETVYVLSVPFRLSPTRIAAALLDFLRQPFIQVDSREEVLNALLLWRERPGTDFADCLLATRASSMGAEVVSFDKHFSQLPSRHICP